MTERYEAPAVSALTPVPGVFNLSFISDEPPNPQWTEELDES